MKNRIDELIKKYQFWEVVSIQPSQIPIKKEIRKLCEKNDCGQYGKNYMCPPAVGSLEDYEKRVNTYKKGLLLSQVFKIESRMDYRRMKEVLEEFGQNMKEFHLEIKQSGIDGDVYSAGHCTLCKKCAILSEQPCRFPEFAMPSLEAAGIDVVKLSSDSGLMYNNGADSFTMIGLLLYND
ncbi:DUF2284 domain-containing protein [Eubacterium callanderi]|uniref:DUF2284 domain-containing protein n=1 Tax=Eubacterium callanderi TaxID=53442 RepID=UPI001C2DD19D|nr:DUF2284 domain-containing protein [Eubacterium callanderi]MBV1684066.1 DUF2284 domain-containing protein [Eubacterium callanderi]